ncbi:tonB-system energizer ExbB [Bradyrhizobium sp.]|uniref:tonB-system energizer ExbB n=1 Tax=Bradyrhizobium sp. TaxID=376 RepID=UPI0039E409CA
MMFMKKVLAAASVALLLIVTQGMPSVLAQAVSPPGTGTGTSPAEGEAVPADVSNASQSPSPAATSVPAALPPRDAKTKSRTDLPHNLSPWGMFLSADWVVKIVMVGLVLASLMTWTVWVAKAVELARAKRRLRQGIVKILSAATLVEATELLANDRGTATVLVREAADEVRISVRAFDHTDGSGVNERVTSRLSRVEAEAGQRMAMGTGILATIGATAPFVGLFGTVWGIMNSFIGISQTQTTNLAVVAPGIAEALLATAFGLVAAIPAVIIYNVFARAITGYRRLLGDASAGIERLVSRDLDMRRSVSVASSARLAAE